MNLPEGVVTTEDILKDIQQSTNGVLNRENSRNKPYSFPVDILPLKAQELVHSAKDTLGIPKDFFAASMIFAAASAVGNSYKLEVKKGVEQKAVFYLVLVGFPNTNKSGGLKTAIKPLSNQDSNNYEEYKLQTSEYEAIKGLTKKERKEQGFTEIPPKPIFKRLVIQDATPEAVALVLQESPRGIALYRDELAGFIKDFNRYNQGGEQEFWLSNWSGINLSIDRKTSEPIRVKNPYISIAGTIQPGVLDELSKGSRKVNGFIDRFLFVWPEGLKKPEWTENEIDLYLLEAYDKAITRLINLPFDDENSAHKLTLSPEAKKEFLQFVNEDNNVLCDDAENETLSGIYGKFDFHTARLVIALHLIHWAYSNGKEPNLQISVDTIRQAIKAAKYFRNQALNVYNYIHNSSPIERLDRDKRAIYEALPEVFKFADGHKIAMRIFPESSWRHERTFRRLLNSKPEIFEKVSRGVFGKLY